MKLIETLKALPMLEWSGGRWFSYHVTAHRCSKSTPHTCTTVMHRHRPNSHTEDNLEIVFKTIPQEDLIVGIRQFAEVGRI